MPRSGNLLTRLAGNGLLKVMGWRIQGQLPDRSKFIIAVAPHSSNIDFVLTVGVILRLGLRCSFLAKASLFRFPLGFVMRMFGGIPVARDTGQGVVEHMALLFRSSPQLILGITPEGTRGKVKKWRSGFAQIAQAAAVPVLPAVVDYQHKCVTFAPLIDDVSDVAATVRAVQTAALAGARRQG